VTKIRVVSIALPIIAVFGSAQFGLAAEPIKIVAKCFSFSPEEVVLKKGVPVTLLLTTEDRAHGFDVPDLKLNAKIVPNKTTELKVTPDKTGEFPFHCDIFCGSGHENMGGSIKVID
jgi:cytochrome c oxidase subunit II